MIRNNKLKCVYIILYYNILLFYVHFELYESLHASFLWFLYMCSTYVRQASYEPNEFKVSLCLTRLPLYLSILIVQKMWKNWSWICVSKPGCLLVWLPFPTNNHWTRMIKKTKKIIKKTQFHVLAIIATQVENRRVFVQVFHRTEAVERSVVKKGAASFF